MNIFTMIKMIDLMLFLFAPVITLIYSFRWLYLKKKKWGIATLVISLLVCILGIYIHFIEPQWVKVEYIDISTRKIDKNMKVVFISDIQTDFVGKYEENVFKKVMQEKADLILIGGDYLQSVGDLGYEVSKLRELLNKLEAPLGVYAVEGNLDGKNMGEVFEPTRVQLLQKTQAIDLGPIRLKALSVIDSADINKENIMDGNKYNIILGHVPNFALGENNGNLLLAGHTHGGQVRLPFGDPLMTLCDIPREWATGATKLTEDKLLYVTNGIGMERANAPRIRFLSRPEIVVFNLKTSIF